MRMGKISRCIQASSQNIERMTLQRQKCDKSCGMEVTNSGSNDGNERLNPNIGEEFFDQLDGC
jgi:hypothetical protein